MSPNSETYNIDCYKELFIVMIDYIIGKKLLLKNVNIVTNQNKTLHIECPFIQGLWLQIIQHFNENTQIKIEMSAVNTKRLILNSITNDPKNIVVNLIILIVKQRIYTAKSLGNTPLLVSMVTKVEMMYQTERYYSYLDRKQEKHRKMPS